MSEADRFYYTAADLAKRYKVHKITIFKWVRAGRLPPPDKLAPNTTRWRSDRIAKHEAEIADK
jgi:predicted DNA-binding transcriptional regulator AlpA